MRSPITLEQGIDAILAAIAPYWEHLEQWPLDEAPPNRPAFNALRQAATATLASLEGRWKRSSAEEVAPTKALQLALRSFAPGSTERLDLVVGLQTEALKRGDHVGIAELHQALERLNVFFGRADENVRLHGGTALELVRLLETVSERRGSNNGGGRSPDFAKRTWVCVAADYWERACRGALELRCVEIKSRFGEGSAEHQKARDAFETGVDATSGEKSPFWRALDAIQDEGRGGSNPPPRVTLSLAQAALRDRRASRIPVP